MGLPDRIIEHGSQLELHTECGIHPEGIAQVAEELLGDINKKQATA
jgi:1-deoxy-D-xylulose-5-phosphate synthase